MSFDVMYAAAVQAEMMQDPLLWSRRPIQPHLVQYAAEDVLQLLSLQDKLKAQLGTAGAELVSKLSAAYSHWHWG